MYYYIYQLSTSPIDASDFIDEGSLLYEDIESFSDYVSKIDDNKYEQAYKDFPFIGTMFKRDDDKLIYQGCDKIFRQWYEYVSKEADKLSEEGLKSSSNTWRVKKALEVPFTEDRFVVSGWDECPEPSSDFLQYCAYSLKKGDVLYLGGVLNYHC